MGSDEAVDNNNNNNNSNNNNNNYNNNNNIIIISIVKKLIVGIRLSPEVMVTITLLKVSLVARSVQYLSTGRSLNDSLFGTCYKRKKVGVT